jgi:D-alanyl-D-alanine carboxypeptidase
MTRVKTGTDNLIVVTFNAKNRAASFLETEQLLRYGLNQLQQAKYQAAGF